MDHGPHPSGGCDQVSDEFLALGLESVSIVLHEEVGKGDQGAQRFLEVMRDRVGELIELAVLPRELFIDAGQAPVLLVQLGLESSLDRDIPGHESGLCRRPPR